MRVPVVQTFLRKLFTEDLPGFMVRFTVMFMVGGGRTYLGSW